MLFCSTESNFCSLWAQYATTLVFYTILTLCWHRGHNNGNECYVCIRYRKCPLIHTFHASLSQHFLFANLTSVTCTEIC